MQNRRFCWLALGRPDLTPSHPVCVEPENGEWPVSLFDGLADEVESAIPGHALQRMFYGDERATREKPERIRRLSITEAVRRRLSGEDQRLARRTFCSEAYPVDDYYVVCVFQLPTRLFQQFPPIEVEWQETTYETSLVHACVNLLLEEGT